MRIPLFVVGALTLAGCRGNLLATAELRGPGTAEAHFSSTGGKVAFWADTEGRWVGSNKHSHFAAHYEIDVLSGTTAVGHVSCDTRGASESVCGSHTYDGSHGQGDCEIKLPCAAPAIPAGQATVKVTGTVGAGTTDVKKMSLNVRAD